MKAHKKLWASVLGQAVKDMRITDEKSRSYEYCLQAHRWINQKNSQPGSFLWACYLLKIDPDETREKMLNAAKKRGAK